MGNKVRLTETELINLIQRVIKEDVSKEGILNSFGFQKKMEKPLPNGSTIVGYSSADPKYSIRVVIVDKGGVDYGKIIYDGPSFGDPGKKEEMDLTQKFLGKEWFPISMGDMFPTLLNKALKTAKNIKDYHGAPSLRESNRNHKRGLTNEQIPYQATKRMEPQFDGFDDTDMRSSKFNLKKKVSMDKKSQIRDIINNFDSINCDGIDAMSGESLFGSRPEREIIYCSYYKSKSKEDLIQMLDNL